MKRLTDSELRRIYNDFDINTCTSCILSKRREKVVPCTGSLTANIIFYGSNPGRQENITGIPFTGMSGEKFIEMLESVGFDKSEYLLSNVVRCYPTEDGEEYRIPNDTEMKACLINTSAEIAYVKPRVIVALGAIAAKALTGKTKSETHINILRGKIFPCTVFSSIPVVVTYNPASIIYATNRESKFSKEIEVKMYEDLIKVKEMSSIPRDNDINDTISNPLLSIMR